MEYENKYASKGLSGTALGIAIGSGVLGLANGGLGNIFSGTGNGNGKCSEDHCVNRYEAAQAARIAELETQNKFLEASIYTDNRIDAKMSPLAARVGALEAQIAQQAVYNGTNTATLNCLSNQIAVLMGLTKTVIPFSSICPTPAAAPTATT